MTLLLGDTRPKQLTDEMWLEIMDRLAPILGDVSQKSARWAMKKTRTPVMTPGTALSNASGTVTVLLDDGATIRARALGVAPALSGDRVMVMHMPPSSMYCFPLYGFPAQGIELVTSTTRPTIGLYAGRMIFESDTTKTLQYDYTNSRWVQLSRLSGAEAYTPVVRFDANVVTSNTTSVSNYNTTGNSIDLHINLQWNSTTASTGTLSVATPPSFPHAEQYLGAYKVVGVAGFLQVAVGRTERIANINQDLGSDRICFGDMNFGMSLITHNSPYTQAQNGSVIQAQIRYRWA